MDLLSSITWLVGRVALWIGGFCWAGAVIYWLFVVKTGIIYNLNKWTEEEKNRIVTMYMYLIGSYCLTLISTMYFFNSPALLYALEGHRIFIVSGTLMCTLFLSARQETLLYTMRNIEKKNWIWFTQSVIIGPSLTYFGTKIFLSSMFDTILAIFLSSLIAYSAPPNYYENLTPIVNFLYSAVFVTSIVNLLFIPPVTPFSQFLVVLDFLNGITLYFLVFAVNTQYVFQQSKNEVDDPINNATVIYLCTLNLYIRISMKYLIENMNMKTGTIEMEQITQNVK